MTRPAHTLRIAFVLGVLAVFLLAACGGGTPAPPPAQVEHVETAADQAEHEEAEHEEAEHEEAEHEEAEHKEAEHEEADHGDDEHGSDEHMTGEAHSVPDEAAGVPNPIQADDESLEAGAAAYAAKCAVCHGETGEGDGPTAEALDKKPADLHESHVQELSDGALFYIISHGSPGTPMPAWEDVLSEEERWHVVNFLRTFGE